LKPDFASLVKSGAPAPQCGIMRLAEHHLDSQAQWYSYCWNVPCDPQAFLFYYTYCTLQWHCWGFQWWTLKLVCLLPDDWYCSMASQGLGIRNTQSTG